MKLKMKLLAAAAILTSTLAYAVPKTSSYTVYYSDATYTEIVGEKIFTCGSNRWMIGEVTPYYTIRIDEC